MKKINLIQWVFIFVLMSLCKNGFGQFKNAGYAENGAGVSVSPNNTGNDILDDGSGDIYRVSVFNDAGTSPGISWEVHYSGNNYTGNLPFSGTSNILHADVSLVYDATDMAYNAVVVWFTSAAGGALYAELFEWDNINTFSSKGATLLINKSWGTTLNIDANQKGSFVIIADDGSANIYVITGTLAGGLSLNNSGNHVTIASGAYPDVALYFNGSAKEIAHVTYVDGSSNLIVDDHDLPTNLAFGTSSPNNKLSQAPLSTFNFTTPRIACPDKNYSEYEWTVVAAEIYRNPSFPYNHTDYIVGVNSDGGSNITGPTIYNDGTIIYFGIPIDLSGVYNYLPVVTYDDNYNTDGIWVGWTFDNSSGMYDDPSSGYTNIINGTLYPLVLKCDQYAIPNAGDYWQVPTTLGSGDAVDLLSMSGRFANDELYLTYYNVNSSGDIYTKRVTASSIGSLRNPGNFQNTQFSEFLNTAFSGCPDNDFLTLNIYDMSGKEVLEQRELCSNFYSIIKKINLPKSAYLVMLTSDDGKYRLLKKIFIGN